MKYLITIKYDGSNFYGFQRLNGKRTVQEEIERALSIINKSKVEIKGAGRTDKGVHAYGQRAHFNLDINIPINNLKKALNDILDDDIVISDIKEINSEDFHARFSVKEKTYKYKICLNKEDPMKHNYYYQLDYDIDIDKLKEVASLYLGIHNFKNFVSGERDNYEAIIYNIDINRVNDNIEITFVGKSFYRYMVRNLVGAMLDVARGSATVDEVKLMLDNYEEEHHLSCAVPQGLYLMEIKY